MARDRIEATISARASSNVTGVTYDANGNYSSGGIPQYRVVVWDTTGEDEVALPSGADVPACGVAISGPTTTGQTVTLATKGRVRVEAHGAITALDLVMVAANTGRITTATAAGNHYIIGQAMQAAANQGELIEVELMLIPAKVVIP